MSFLNKLKGTSTNQETGDGTSIQDQIAQNEKEQKKDVEFTQIEVDVFQTTKMIVIMAQLPGVDINEVDLSIENENDVITIQGVKLMPVMEEITDTRKYLRQECKWGEFYRQIILPQEINVPEVEARFEKGVLLIKLPFLRIQDKGKKKIKIGK